MMKIKPFILLFIPLAFLIIYPAFAEKTKEELYNILRNKYEKLNSVEITYSREGGMPFNGFIKAKKGNKYYLKTQIMTVVCNGKTIWNYDQQNKKVIISNFEQNSINGFSVDKLFFTFLTDFYPERLTKENLSNGKSTYKLTFTAKSANPSSNIRGFSLWLDKNTGNILSAEVIESGNRERFDIENIKVNPKISDKFFDFKIPKGVETVDLR